MEDERPAGMVDIAFGVRGSRLPRDHRVLLAASVQRILPWLRDHPGAGLHRMNLARGDAGCDLLSGRTRLMLRVPRERAADAAALCGAELEIAGHCLSVGAARQRELLAHGTLYAHLVVGKPGEESAFMAWLDEELAALGVTGRAICGRWQAVEAHALVGCSLMLDGLARESSLRVLERGLGRHRGLGCGLFVPHRSAAAVA
ncbi:MAG: type I-MYXAN CRISPR-associated protein Cas6/Cmx6 [Burkholderiales bacterium]|nr:type I-MYXAN CRISPR-associated protein Cas6/Cmx6 [Burkholderiales bacterium]